MTILTDIHIKHNRPDIIILNKQQKQAYLLAVPNSHNITQTYNTKINKYLDLSVAMRNLWCLEKKTECVIKTHDRSETFVLQGNIVIIHQSLLNSIFTTKLYILMKKINYKQL
jgi:hypothetical protein